MIRRRPEQETPPPDEPGAEERAEDALSAAREGTERDPWVQACPVCGLLGCRRHA